MASTITHLAIAKRVKDLLSIKIQNDYDYYLGAIAPDLSKQIGQDKEESHFLINTKDNLPNIDLFVKRYPLFPYNSFDLGYYVHLYTDKIWSEEFMTKIILEDSVKLLDGTTLKTTKEEIANLIYSDYTNLNTQIINEYDLDLSIFYEDLVPPKTEIKEIPVEMLDILINKISIIIENSKEEKTYTFDIYTIKNFIEDTAKRIVEEIEKY